MKILLVVASSLLWTCHCYVFDASSSSTKADIAKTQMVQDWNLNIRLKVGEPPKNGQHHSTNQFIMDGLQLCLYPDAPADLKATVPMPGGDQAKRSMGALTSSGVRSVDVTKEPFFIGMNGMEHVKLEQGAWEMCGRNDWYPGSLICGFNVPKEVARNKDSKLPAGGIYVCFPLFSPEVLMHQQAAKAQAVAEKLKFDSIKRQKLAEMQQTSNLVKKAFLYRDAAQAYESSLYTSVDTHYKFIPSSMDEVIELQPGVLVGREGTIWGKGSDLFGRLQLQNVIGQAHLHRPKTADTDLKDLRP